MHAALSVSVWWTRPSSCALALCATLATATPIAAQQYSATDLACAAFRQAVDGKVRTELNGNVRLEQTGRNGRLLLSLGQGAGSAPARLWWDSLSVWREADGLRSTPETDGLLGGRYVGTLGAHGGWTGTQLPFIPDDVAAIADLTGVPDDLLPLLPPDTLRVGGAWSDTAGTTVTRLADSVSRGRRWRRFSIKRESDHEEERNVGGPKPAHVSDTESESGQLTWDPVVGPWRWDRSIVAETRIVADPTRAFRSRLEERITLQRVTADPAECVVR